MLESGIGQASFQLFPTRSSTPAEHLCEPPFLNFGPRIGFLLSISGLCTKTMLPFTPRQSCQMHITTNLWLTAQSAWAVIVTSFCLQVFLSVICCIFSCAPVRPGDCGACPDLLDLLDHRCTWSHTGGAGAALEMLEMQLVSGSASLAHQPGAFSMWPARHLKHPSLASLPAKQSFVSKITRIHHEKAEVNNKGQPLRLLRILGPFLLFAAC